MTRKQVVRTKNPPQPHGRDAVVVIDADEFLRLNGERSRHLLVDALQASPHRDIEIEPHRSVMPVRGVTL